ncbi:MAG: ATP synthase F0 subunit B [Deltaproteobacteria bacterium]|nr:MAG: ATP synthase F0 subunit B [Deltaproteobacteria bacterium]
MKRLNMIKISIIFLITLGMSLFLIASVALATDSSSHWRPTFDLVMRWLNFGILVFLLIKFGKNPLLSLLRKRKEELHKKIKQIEEQRKEAAAKVEEIQIELDQSAERLAEIKQRIIKQGEDKKRKIIQDAQQESKILLQEAKRRIDTQVLIVKKKFQAEMIEEAMKIVFKKLPEQITEEDNQNFLAQYLARVL